MASLSSKLTSVTVSFSGLRVTNGNKKKSLLTAYITPTPPPPHRLARKSI